MKLANVTALASAVGIALVGAGMSSSLEASAPANDLVAQAGQFDSATGRYIITFSEPGLVSYKGDVAGLARTAPDDRLFMAGASRKLDANSSAAQAYKSYLQSKRAEHISSIEQAFRYVKSYEACVTRHQNFHRKPLGHECSDGQYSKSSIGSMNDWNI